MRFSKKWYNPLYFIINDLSKDETIRTILIYGGKSSAKTQSICQFLQKELVLNSRSSIALRKESSTIPTAEMSIFYRFSYLHIFVLFSSMSEFRQFTFFLHSRANEKISETRNSSSLICLLQAESPLPIMAGSPG